MAWNPEPQIAALREFSRQFNRPIVVAFSIDKGGERFHIDTFGKTTALCKVAAGFGGTMAKLVTNGTLAPPIGPKAVGFASAVWTLEHARLGNGVELAGKPELARADDLLIMRALLAGTARWRAATSELAIGGMLHSVDLDNRGVPVLTPETRAALTRFHG